MSEGYCDKCKARKEIVEGVEELLKNGRRSVKGTCPSCGKDMFKILEGKASTASDIPASESPSE